MTSSKSVAASRGCKHNHEPSDEEGSSNKTSQEQQSGAQRVVARAIEGERLGLEGMRVARLPVLRLFGRIERLREQTDRAFGGQPFLRNVAPDSPANRRRFNAYFDCHSKLTRLLGKAIELWMLTYGMKTEDDWVPLLMAQMQQNDAKSRANPSNGTVMDRLRAALASDNLDPG